MTIFLVGFVSGLSVATIIVIVWAPWREVRAEPPLDETVEARLLLGEDPAEVAHDLEEESETSPVPDVEPEWDTAELRALQAIDEQDGPR